ncbi:unnamed protein product [Polarella glacialis]|uniref:Uncharacterized protein n=1 Tax=Polarella glacialis TaxID=89957 RepID=A0A813LVN9_POLGL|nr:unnamed protein product [Polarella glacialis]
MILTAEDHSRGPLGAHLLGVTAVDPETEEAVSDLEAGVASSRTFTTELQSPSTARKRTLLVSGPEVTNTAMPEASGSMALPETVVVSELTLHLCRALHLWLAQYIGAVPLEDDPNDIYSCLDNMPSL